VSHYAKLLEFAFFYVPVNNPHAAQLKTGCQRADRSHVVPAKMSRWCSGRDCGDFMSSKALVTGAAGFIGSHVCRHLILQGRQVVALDDLSGGFRDQVPPDAGFAEGFVADNALVEGLFAEHHFERAFHLAAYAPEGLSHFIKRFNYTNNLMASVNLINAAVNYNVDCFVFTSSIAAYGRNQVPMAEDFVPQPEDPYGIAKHAVELDPREAYKMFGLNYVVYRPHNVYGENQNIGDRYRNVIGIFMNQIMQGQPMMVFGNGNQTRAFTSIDDVAPVIAASIARPAAYNQVFNNVGADYPYSVLHLAQVVAKPMGVEPNIKFLEPRNEVCDAYSSHVKVQSLFGDLIKNISLETGIAKMAAWVKPLGPRRCKPFGGIEVRKHMPPSWAATLQD
jgi:UDP-glucose 4-epimerase